MAVKKGKDTPSSPKQKYRLQLTRRGVWFWIFSISFISAWMFALGILVGRGTAPVRFDIHKLQKELAELKKKAIKEELRRFKIDKDTLEDKPDFAFYEELKSTKEEITLPENPIQKKATSPSPEPSAEKEPVHPASSVTEPKQNQTSPVPAEPEEIRLSIQVASVREQKDADQLVAHLKGKGFPAYRIIAKIPGKGIWFRIRVGPYKSRVEADRALRRLERDKFSGYLVND